MAIGWGLRNEACGESCGIKSKRRPTVPRAALLSLPLAVALAALATWASTLEVTTGTIVLFDPAHLAFWLVGVAGDHRGHRRRTLRAAGASGKDGSTRPASRRSHAADNRTPPRRGSLGGVLLISIYHSVPIVLIAPLLAGSALGAALIARYHLEDESGQARRVARTAHILLTHGVAFVLATIYPTRPAHLSATAVAIIVCLLLVQIADGERFRPSAA